ncbi:hypothetical protein [Tomitella gaofuii]|uniref:hypothetical protein n=1 Tax=Tomitella gaofuii TaxID=2760083 RepID=UPI0015FBDD18|nr:hypothetical protein [Tomitella gaofuii]
MNDRGGARPVATAASAASAAAAAATAVVMVALVVYPPLRLGAAALFCLLAPGSGWAWRLARTGRIRPADRLAVALVLSVCATTAVATAMVVSGLWSVAGGIAALSVVTAGGFASWPQFWRGMQGRLLRARTPRRRLVLRRARSGGCRGADVSTSEPR